MIDNIKNLVKLNIENKQYLINISSYFSFILSNLVFLIFVPNELSKIFFINYSIANGIFTYLVVLLFSQKKIIDVRYFLIFFLTTTIYCYFFEDLISLIWLYTFILIYADYFFSQKKYIKSNLFIKLFLLLFSCLLLFDQFTIYVIMNIKILFLMICITIFYILRIDISYPLEIKKPNFYVISTTIIYFGSLYVIAFVSVNEFIKLLYISFQIFLSIRLKIFDLNIRGILKLNRYRKILFFLTIIYFMLISIYSNSYFILILFLFSYLSLDYVKKKFIQN